MTLCNNIFLLKRFVSNYFDQFYILHFITITIINFLTLILTGSLLITILSSIDKVFTFYKHVCYYYYSPNDGRKTIQEFHRNLRKSLQTTVGRNNSTLHAKYGRWLPKNKYIFYQKTDKVQPIDAGYGKMIKKKIGESMEGWLENDDILTKWHDKISATERRVLMTKWTGETWREISDDEEFLT